MDVDAGILDADVTITDAAVAAVPTVAAAPTVAAVPTMAVAATELTEQDLTMVTLSATETDLMQLQRLWLQQRMRLQQWMRRRNAD